jgi:hypothetical protein
VTIACAHAAVAVPASAATAPLIGKVRNGHNFTDSAPNLSTGTVDPNVTGSMGGVHAEVYGGTTLAGNGKHNSMCALALAARRRPSA